MKREQIEGIDLISVAYDRRTEPHVLIIVKTDKKDMHQEPIKGYAGEEADAMWDLLCEVEKK